MINLNSPAFLSIATITVNDPCPNKLNIWIAPAKELQIAY
jgi:hypothetical protein